MFQSVRLPGEGDIMLMMTLDEDDDAFQKGLPWQET